MANIQKLNSRDHGDVGIIQDASEFVGTIYAPVMPNEFRSLQSCFPLLFTKHTETKVLQPVALFGLEAGENLFIDGGKWQSPYVPMLLQRGPLLIGTDSSDSAEEATRFVAINCEHNSVSRTNGMKLFNDEGENTPYLDRLATLLEGIHQGSRQAEAFTQLLSHLELISPLNFQISLANGKTFELTGLLGIDDEKLHNADDGTLTELRRNGFLSACFMMVASMSQLKQLVYLKNQRLHDATAVPDQHD